MLVLYYQMHLCGVTPLCRLLFMDSLQWARHKIRDINSFGLSDLCATFNYHGEYGTHRAMPDVNALIYVLLRLCESRISLIGGLVCEYGNVSLSVVDGIGPGTARRIISDSQPCTLWGLYNAILLEHAEFSPKSCKTFMEKYVAADKVDSACKSCVDMFHMLYL